MIERERDIMNEKERERDNEWERERDWEIEWKTNREKDKQRGEGKGRWSLCVCHLFTSIVVAESSTAQKRIKAMQ